MAMVHIPASLRVHCEGREKIEVSAESLRGILGALEAAFPRLAGKLRQGDQLVSGSAASIDGVIASQGLRTPTRSAREIHFHPAIGGGC